MFHQARGHVKALPWSFGRTKDPTPITRFQNSEWKSKFESVAEKQFISLVDKKKNLINVGALRCSKDLLKFSNNLRLCLRKSFPLFVRTFFSSYELMKNAFSNVRPFCTFLCADINTGGVTMIKREAYVNKNYLLDNFTSAEKQMFANAFNSTILMNIRTYDRNSVIMYINDHLNNFVHVYIRNGKVINFSFNYGREIKNVSVECPGWYR